MAMFAGGFTADLWFAIFKAGLVATPSPGSIFAYLAVIPKGQHFAVLGGVTLAAIASAIVGVIVLRAFPVAEIGEDDEDDEEMVGIPGLA